MFSRGGLLFLCGFGAFSLLASPAAAQQQIGTTHRVTPAAHGSVAGTLAVGSGVHADETIGTDKGGVAGLRFHDQSTLDVGPNSSVRLNKFIYDPNRSGGKAVFGSRPARRAATATFRSKPRLGRSAFAAEVKHIAVRDRCDTSIDYLR
jgi:hypothetical protein